jgi:hypothetical protein
VSRFLDTAQELLDAAEAVLRLDSASPEWTVLIAPSGAVSLVANSDWPLEALARERGAAAAYRVRPEKDRLVVEGRAGTQACLLATARPNGAARALLPNQRLYLSEARRIPD